MAQVNFGPDDWGFRINPSTGDFEVLIPKKDSYKPEELDRVFDALDSVHHLLEELMDACTDESPTLDN